MKYPVLITGMLSVLAVVRPVAQHPDTGDRELVKMAVHLDTQAGGGRYSVRDIAGFLSEKGLDGAVITDHDNAVISYGFAPVRNLVKVTRRFPSIEEYGAAAYLEDIEEASEMYPHLILIPGAEAVPFYYWKGHPATRDLELVDWHKHLLVVGMDRPEQFENLPALHRGFGRGGRLSVVKLVAAVGILMAGIWLARKRVERTFSFDRLRYRMVSRRPRIPGYIVVGFAVLLLADMSLQSDSPVDQYHGDAGTLPYQQVIDYAGRQEALTFWSHPEAAIRGRHNGARYETKSYHLDLLRTEGYDGFAIFWQGDREVGAPGGVWDHVLLEYTAGERIKPVWAIGELDWEGEGDSDLIGETVTLCFAGERSVRGVLEAMRSGSMAAVRKGFGTSIDSFDFGVRREDGVRASSGRVINVQSPPEIFLRLTCRVRDEALTSVRLIRNGIVIDDAGREYDEEYVYRERERPAPGEIWYYRVLVGGRFPVIATNPVFVRGTEDGGNGIQLSNIGGSP